MSDGLVVPELSFAEEDGAFHGVPRQPAGPALLPGTSRQVRFDGADDLDDAFCNARFDYQIGINVLTFTSL